MQKYEIIEMGRKLYEKDLTFATSGNISVKTDRGIFITASGSALGNLKDCDLTKRLQSFFHNKTPSVYHF